jgi:hypothetical protein
MRGETNNSINEEELFWAEAKIDGNWTIDPFKDDQA